jgi:hypothetical protein
VTDDVIAKYIADQNIIDDKMIAGINVHSVRTTGFHGW